LRRKLPLLISAVLSLVVLGVCVSAYHQLTVVLVATAEQRILGAMQQLGSALDQQTRTLMRDGRRLAADSTVVRAFTHPSDLRESALKDIFAREQAAAPQWSEFRLLHRDGRTFLTIDSARVAIPRPRALTVAPERSGGDSMPLAPGVGPLVASGNSIHFDIVTPVLRAEHDTVGFLVATRRTRAANGGQLIGRLIGSDARLLFGNLGDALWTDLDTPMSGPPKSLPLGVPTEVTTPEGKRLITAAVRLSAMPWLVVVQIPRDSALLPARRFLFTIIGIAVLLLLAGVAAAWRLSRQITEPLAEIASAAEDFATGNYARRVAVVRHDELGSMASAFNGMAEKVETASRDTMLREQELRATNRELRESEERYRQLVELSPEAIVVHRDGIILFVNPAAIRLFGNGSDTGFTGRALLDFVPPVDRDSVWARVQQVQTNGQATPLVERTLRRVDGTSVDVETAGLPFILDGEPAVLTLIRDVTQRKRLEGQIRQAQKMEAIGQLAGGVAHDFNNLLTVIMSYSGLLMSNVDANSDFGRDLGEIKSAAERAAGLTHQLLAFSRRQVLQPQILDVTALTRRLEAMLRRLLREDIELVTMFEPSLDPVSADPGQIEQVIINLAVNAGDAMPQGGRLVIETSRVELDDESPMLPAGAAPGPFVVLAVSDTGHGMDEAVRSKIFDPFFTTKEPGKGTGLGLSTVYGIVQQSGGSISVYSEPGIGTTFKVYLPRAVPDDSPRSTPTSRPPIASGSETVLLVEDDAGVRAAAQRVLERAGYTVLLASTGAEALEVIERHGASVGVVLTDLVMPEMGGRELADHLNVRWPQTKIVFMSGYTEDAASRASVLAPGALFLDKPFTPETLARKVRGALHGESATVPD
jgi:PAS domain S-box-containing protein